MKYKLIFTSVKTDFNSTLWGNFYTYYEYINFVMQAVSAVLLKTHKYETGKLFVRLETGTLKPPNFLHSFLDGGEERGQVVT